MAKCDFGRENDLLNDLSTSPPRAFHNFKQRHDDPVECVVVVQKGDFLTAHVLVLGEKTDKTVSAFDMVDSPAVPQRKGELIIAVYVGLELGNLLRVIRFHDR